MAKGDDCGCVTRQITRQRCAPEEVEPGKHVFRCEKTVQTLRDCIGRSTELIDSETEITEHEMEEGWSQGLNFSMEQSQSSSSSSTSWDRNFMPMFDDALQEFERMTEGIMGEVERIAEEAERIAGSLFSFPSFPREERDERSRNVSSFPVKEEEGDSNETYEMQGSPYSEYADKIKDV